jgi:predicted naringenin-chalcone synthase
MPVFITKPVTAIPPERYTQSEIMAYMLEDFSLSEEEERKVRAVYKESGIGYRHSVLSRFRDPAKHNDEISANTQQRMAVYADESLKTGLQLMANLQAETLPEQGINVGQITHLVWVSCTGMTAPGLETEILRRFPFHPSIQVTAFNFMGCHGFFHALRYGTSVVQSEPGAVVLILCVELCTLHFKTNSTEDQILANSLFGDGGAATLVLGNRPSGPSLEIRKQVQKYVHSSADQMAWQIGEHGFDMRLSRKLPVAVSRHILSALDKLWDTDIQKEALNAWILHPGGKRILDVLQKALNIPDQGMRPSREVLRMVGNVSSASVLFALRQFLETKTEQASGNGLMLGIGPGLAIESAAFVY